MKKIINRSVSVMLAAVLAFSGALSVSAASYEEYNVAILGEELAKESGDESGDAEESSENNALSGEELTDETPDSAGETEESSKNDALSDDELTDETPDSAGEAEESPEDGVIPDEEVINETEGEYEDDALKLFSGDADSESELSETISDVALQFLQTEGYSHRVGMGGYVGMLADGSGDLYTWGVIDERAAREGESTPGEVDLNDIIFVASTTAMGGAAINKDNKLFVWGDNNWGRVGNGESGYYTDSVPVPYEVPLNNVKYAATGTCATAAVLGDGSLYVWGRNDDYYSIGIEREGNKISSYPTPQRIDAISNALQVAVGRDVLVLTASGEVYSTRDTEGLRTYSFNKVSGLSNVVSINAGDYGYSAVTASGEAYTWGDDYLGHLGLGNTKRTTYNTPQRVGISNVKNISLGSGSSLLLTRDGDVYAAGTNMYGQLGLGKDDSASRYSFEKIPGLSDIDSVFAGYSVYEWTTHAAVSSDGDLYTWGYNGFDQIGLGKTVKSYYNKPVYIGNLAGKWKWANDLFDLRSDGYCLINASRSFDINTNTYVAPYERYSKVFNDSFTENHYKSLKPSWNGNCLGMAATAALFDLGIIRLDSYVSDGKNLNNGGQTGSKNELSSFGRKYRVLDKETDLYGLIEEYQLWNSSAEFDNLIAGSNEGIGSNRKRPSASAAQDFYSSIVRSKIPYLICVSWDNDDGSRSGHTMLVNTCKMPEDLGAGWKKINIYDPNYPYYDSGKYGDTEVMLPSKSYDSAEEHYLHINTLDGSWRIDGININSDGQDINVGDDPKNPGLNQGYIYFIDPNTIPSSFNSTLNYAARKGEEIIDVGGDSIIVKDRLGKAVFKKTKGTIEYIDKAIVSFKEFFGGELEENEELRNDRTVILPADNYSIDISNGYMNILSDDGDFSSVSTTGTIECTTFSEGLLLDTDKTAEVDLVLEDKSDNNSFNSVSTSFVVGKKGAEISLTGNRLTLQNPITQNIDIHSESSDGEVLYTDIPVADTLDFDVSSGTISEEISDSEKENLDVSGIEAKNYSGSLIYQDIKVYDSGALLTKNKDYTLTYKNNKNVYLLNEGDEGFNAKKAPSITITGKGNYEGKETVYFRILPQNISEKEFSADDITLAATGKKQKVVSALYWNGKALKNNTEYSFDIYKADDTEFATRLGSSVTEAGQYVLRFTGKGNFTGTRNIRLTVTTDYTLVSKLKISKPTTYVYTGEAITPEPEVKNGNTLLTKDVHYTLSYASNINVGTGYVIVSGVPENGYSGTKRMAFTIKAPKQAKAVKYDISPSKDTEQRITVTCDSPAVFMKGGAKPAVSVTFKNDDGTVATLLEGTDYKLSYKNNTSFGGKKAPLVVVTGMGSFKGRRECAFEITEKSLSEVTLLVDDVTYKNKPGSYAARLTLTDEDGKQLKAGKDYDKKAEYTYLNKTDVTAGGTTVTRAAGDPVEKADIIPVGTVIKVTVKAKPGSGYTGSASGTYKITKESIATAKVTIPAQTYTGKPITLDKSTIKVAMKKQKLTESDFEIVSYSGNVQKGTARVTIRGVGNYGGLKTQTFKIKSKGFRWWWRK